MTVKLICSQSLYYRDLVLKQLVDVHVAQEVTFPILDSLADALPVATRGDGPSGETKFGVKPDFRAVLLLQGVDNRQEVFTYSDLLRYFSCYILGNKDRFIDPRNKQVVMCGLNDPLGKAFGVSAFHRSQVQ
jgi:hypothetical protein